MTALLVLAAALAVALWPHGRGRGPRSDGAGPGGGPVRRGVPGPAASGATGRVPPPALGQGLRVRRVRRVRPVRRAPPEPSPDAVADALVLVALALRAGLDLTRALEEVAAGADPRVSTDLSRVVAAVRWGRTVDEAWSYAGAVWRPAALAWAVADATGAAPAALVADAAGRLREGQERDRERRAARAGVLLVLPLGLGFLPAFACTAVVPVVIALAVGVLDGAAR